MTEKDYYANATKYYTQRAVELGLSFAVELKITKTNVLSFKCLPAHQEEKLLQAERAYGHKIADVGRQRKPFDIMVVQNAEAVVIAIFYTPGKSEIYEISIRNFLAEKYTSGKSSLTKERASQIGRKIKL